MFGSYVRLWSVGFVSGVYGDWVLTLFVSEVWDLSLLCIKYDFETLFLDIFKSLGIVRL